MPQISKGARLWLERQKGRKPVWRIRDGKLFISTGYGIEDRAKAEERLADYITSRRPDTGRRDTSEIWVSEVLTLYQTDLPQNSPSRELVGYHVANLLRYWGDKSLAQVKGSTCREYCARRVGNSATASLKTTALQAKRVKPSTARRELKTLSAAINHWHKESALVAVPKVTLPDEGERRERVLERSEVARMLWACRKRKWDYVARFIIIGVRTGSRRGAILALRWHNSLSNGHIDLQRGILYRRGAGERETSKRRPPVAIGGALHAFLQRWRDADEKLGLPYVIHYKAAPVQNIKRAWRTICRDAALGPEVTPHTLRHTCATWLLWQGWTIWDVAGHVGADATTIQKIYGHHRLEAKERKKA